MWYQQQGIMLLFTLMWIRQQYYATWAYRQKYPKDCPELQKLHDYNFVITFIVGFVVAIPLFNNPILPFWTFIFNAVANGVLFTTVFDPGYALAIGEDFFYLGETANNDKQATKILGKNAGQIKFFFGLFCLLVLHLFYLIFLK